MKQKCARCGKEFKDGDSVKAVVLSVFREVPSAVTFAIEKPYECISLEHVDCKAQTQPE